MKKVLLFVSIVGMLMVGCSSKEVKTTAPAVVEKQNVVTDNRPKWVRVGYGEGFSAVGRFNVGTASEQFAVNQAMLAGRAELANMYKVMVETYTDSVEENLRGNGTPVNASTFSDVRKAMARQTLLGSKQMDSYYDEKRDVIYVLVGVDEKVAKEQVTKQFETALKNDDVMYQKYLAEKKLDKMSASLDKAFNTGLESANVEE